MHTHLPEKLRDKEINFSSKRLKAILQGKKFNPWEKNYFWQNSISLKVEGIQFCKKELFLKSWMWHWMTFQVSGGIFRGFQRIGTDHFDSQGWGRSTVGKRDLVSENQSLYGRICWIYVSDFCAAIFQILRIWSNFHISCEL